MSGRRGRRRVTWAVIRTLEASLVAAVFVAALAVGAFAHLDIPAGRRLVARALSLGLSRLFYGAVEIGRVEHVDLYSLVATDVVVHAPDGKLVLSVSELTARADLPVIARDLLFRDDVDVVVRYVRAEYAEGQILPDAEGIPTIAAAFKVRSSPESEPSAPSAKPPRRLRVWLPDVEIGRAFARGTVAGLPTMEASLASVKGSILVRPEGVAVDVARFGTVVRGLAGADARGTGTLHIRAPGAIWTSFDGYFGDVELGAFTRIDGERLSVRVDLPRAAPSAARALFSSYPLEQDATLHLEANGTLPTLAAEARIELGRASFEAKGPLTLAGAVGAKLEVTARHVNLEQLFAAAPRSELSADGAVEIWSDDGAPVVDVNLTTLPGRIATEEVPAVDVIGTYDRAGFKGVATFHERGLPLKASVAVAPDGVIDVDARARTFSLQGAPRVARYTRATGVADVRVKARIADGKLEADVSGSFEHLALGPVRLAQGRLSGRATGPLARPSELAVDARLTGSDLGAGLFGFARVEARAVGPVRRPRVTTRLDNRFGPSVSASGTVTTIGKTRVEGLTLAVEREGIAVRGQVATLDVAAGRVDVDALHFEGGGGTLDGSVHVRPGLIAVTASGSDLDLGEISRALGLPRGTMGGKFRVDADVTTSEELSRGKLRFGLGNGTLLGLEGVSLDGRASLEGARFDGSAQVLVREVGAFGASWETTLGGAVEQAESWRGLTGMVRAQMTGVSLAGLEHLLPASLQVEKLTGMASGWVHVERARADALPVVTTLMETKGLTVARRAPGAAAAQTISGLELKAGGSLNGESGETALTARLVDDKSVLATLTGTTTIDFDQAIAHPERLASTLADTPMKAVLTVDERDFGELPELIRPPGLAGTITAQASFVGTPAEPEVTVSLDAKRLFSGDTQLTTPVDVRASGRYVRRTGEFGGMAELSVGSYRVAQLSADGVAKWEDLTGDRPLERPRWTGRSTLAITRMPLAIFGPLANAQIRGEVSGVIALDRRGALPKISANLAVGAPTVRGIPVGTGHLLVSSDGERLSAGVSFEKGTSKLAAEVRAALGWDGLVPSLAPGRPVVIGVDATRFDAVVLQPLLRDVLSELGGEISAKLAVTLQRREADGTAGASGEPEWDADITGTGALVDGVLQLSALGLELANVELRATASRVGGQTRIQIDGVRAAARADRQNLEGSATLFLDGLRVASGTARLAADPRAPVPFLVQGVPLASIDTGNDPATRFVEVTLKREPALMKVEVSVPRLRARLPKSQSRDVVSVADNPDIHVIQPLSERTAPRSDDALPWKLSFSLGDVRVTRSDVEVPVSGRPVLVLDKTATMGGYVTLEPGGRVPALGHVFIIENGAVYFDTGEASNPRVDVTASWRAPEGTTIYATIRGRFKEAAIKLTSDPAMPEPQIVALLLGGSPSIGSAAPSGEALAAGAASQLGLNDLLSDTPFNAVQFSAGSRENQYGASNTAYTASVRVSDEVWVEGTYEQAGAAEKSDPNSAAPAFSAAVDWRFHKDWSLRTEIGTATTALDLLWSYRY